MSVTVYHNRYKWVIVFALFNINALTWGLLYAVGVFYYNWVDYFDESRGIVAIAAALPTAIGCLLGEFIIFAKKIASEICRW